MGTRNLWKAVTIDRQASNIFYDLYIVVSSWPCRNFRKCFLDFLLLRSPSVFPFLQFSTSFLLLWSSRSLSLGLTFSYAYIFSSFSFSLSTLLQFYSPFFTLSWPSAFSPFSFLQLLAALMLLCLFPNGFSFCSLTECIYVKDKIGDFSNPTLFKSIIWQTMSLGNKILWWQARTQSEASTCDYL